MWNCHQCGAENGDTSAFCASCGNRRAANAAGAATPPPPMEESRATGGAYHERHCEEARQLQSWGEICFIVGIVIGVILFLGTMLGGCAAIEEASSSTEAGVFLSTLFTAAIGGGSCVLGGFLSRVTLRAFAIITEAHYRKLRDR